MVGGQADGERKLAHDDCRWLHDDLRGVHSDFPMNCVSPVPTIMSAMSAMSATVSIRNETARGQEEGENAGEEEDCFHSCFLSGVTLRGGRERCYGV